MSSTQYYLISFFKSYGGGERFIELLLESVFTKKNFLTIISPSDELHSKAENYSTYRRFKRSNIFRILLYFLFHSHSTIILNCMASARLAPILSSLGHNVIIIRHTMPNEPSSIIYLTKLRELIFNLCAIFSATVVYVNHDSYLESILPATKKYYIPNWPLLRFKSLKRYNRAQYSPSLGKPLHILTIARLDKNKNTETLIRSLRYINYPILLTICGDGPLAKSLQALEYPTNHSVIFLGFTDKIEKLFDLCDLYVTCSFYESSPMNVLEAQAAMVPVIASKIKAHSLIPNIYDFFDPNSSYSLSKAITKFISEPVSYIKSNDANNAILYKRILDL